MNRVEKGSCRGLKGIPCFGQHGVEKESISVKHCYFTMLHHTLEPRLKSLP